jgi:hypothetical protein
MIFMEKAAPLSVITRPATSLPLDRDGLTPILTHEACASLAGADRDWSEG